MLSCALIVGTACAEGAERAAPLAAAQGDVTITRDSFGVPHLYADSTFGLFYGFGYALAEDHLFQMDVLLRTATGRAAEVFGAKYLDTDRRARLNLDPRAIEAQYRQLAPKDRAIFDGYAAGYNARVGEVLAARPTLLPQEFAQFGFDPTSWTGLDVLLAYVHSMAMRYSDSNLEIENLALLAELQRTHGDADAWAIFDQLRWESDAHAPTTIEEAEQTQAAPPTFVGEHSGNAPRGIPQYLVPPSAASQRVAMSGSLSPDSFPRASNVWLLGPGRTTSGETVLINGPQMGHFWPGYIWAVGLHGAGYDLVGSGPLGSPWLIFGSNGHIGWGATAGMGDTVDVYQERLDPDDAHRYLFRGHYRPMAQRIETIDVKDAASVKLTVHSTIHGPVIQVDTGSNVAYSRKRTWAGHEVESLVAWMHSMQAQNHTQWLNAISKVSLTINNYFIDERGHIAYAFLGRFPRRPANQDFRLPASGTGDMEWQGWLPFASNPHIRDPRRGYIANWNNKPQPRYNDADWMYWGAADHVREVMEPLDGDRRLSIDDAWAIVRAVSFRDVNARYFVPLILAAAHDDPKNNSVRRAADMLGAWNSDVTETGPEGKEAAAETLLHRFLAILIDDVLHADVPSHAYRNEGEVLPASVLPYYSTTGTKAAYNALLGAAAGVPQRFDFLKGRQPSDVIRHALEAAYDALTTELGADPGRWAKHPSEHIFSTRNYAGIPNTDPARERRWPVLMNRGTENNEIVFGKGGMRFCDVTPPGESAFIDPVGTTSPHYSDQLEIYRTFACKQESLHPKPAESTQRRQLHY